MITATKICDLDLSDPFAVVTMDSLTTYQIIVLTILGIESALFVFGLIYKTNKMDK